MSFLTANKIEYHAFAKFTFSATTYRLGTQTEVRADPVQQQWFDGLLKTTPQLQMAFGNALTLVQASNIDLVIGDGAGGTYRTLADQNILDGTAVQVTLVERTTWNDSSVTELTYVQMLTIVGQELAPSTVTLHLQDLENQKLAALYPLTTWKVDDWPDLSSDDAGKAICEPVGTAVKFACAMLRSDTTNNEYWYGVCTGTQKSINISSVNSGTKTITLASAPTIALTVGQIIIVTGSTAADGRYTVASGSSTTVVVNETLPASTGGTVRLMPVPLTVYRNKRIVSSGEYTAQTCYSAGTVSNGNFASGSTGWTTTTAGAGASATFTTGNCAIACVNSSNYAYISQNATGKLGPGAFYAISITLAAGSDGVIDKSGPPQIAGKRLTAGKTTTVLLASNASGSDGFKISTWNYSGTCNVTNVVFVPYSLTLLKFSTPQIDFNGTPYAIEADVLGVESRDACSEIKRLLGIAGVGTDTTTFNAAIAQTFAKLVDCDYGRTGQRKISAILDDLLWVARAGLSRAGTGAGNYTIWQDVAGSPVLTLDESLADPVQVEKIGNEGRPASVGLNCAPSSSDANTMQVQLTRPVSGGVLGAEPPRELRYLRDPTTMDQALCYRALRAQYNRIATATIYRTQNNIGDIVTLTSARNWVGARTFTIWAIERVPKGNKCTLHEYNSAVYTYTASPLPGIASAGYQPDYSATPPAAPTLVKVLATGTSTDGAGTTTAYAQVSAVPPVVNWQTLWFAAIHNVAGTITLVPATFTAGVYKATISGLRQGEVYKLQCYATAGTLQGAIASTFDATAIGGGGAVTTFTTAGTAQVPANVSSCSAFQGIGNTIGVSWPSLASTTMLQAYVLEQKLGAGAFTQIWQGNALSYQDSALTYGIAYQYRVRARDTYGNFSASYATSSTVTPVGNVTGGTSGDITSTTVATTNRTNVTTVTSATNTATTTNSVPTDTVTLTHSLGRVPVMSSLQCSSLTFPNLLAVCTGLGTTTAQFQTVNLRMQLPIPVTAGNANLTFSGIGPASISCDFW
jgi:hypothetical protein